MVFGTSAMAFAATVSINKTSAVIAVGNTQTLQLKNVKKSGKIIWKTSNSTVATVSRKGVVKGVSEGKAKITGKYNGKSYSCKITVVHARNQQELEELINQIISKSDKLGMSKEDIIKLIDEKISKIPPSSSTVIYQCKQKETTLLPSYAIDYKTTKGNIVHLNPSTFEITNN